MDKDLKNKTFFELEDIVLSLGAKKYQAKYIFSFVHAKNVTSVEQITTMKKYLRPRLLDEGYYISQLETVETFNDPDGTVKYLFQLSDCNRIESVLLTDGGEKKRKTLCISCQAGCRMGCKFCATAKLKFKRNLTAGEIADQVNQVVQSQGKINNIVYMGMGEPLDNYDEVMRSVNILNFHAGQYIGQRHISISTCGIADKIEKLADEEIVTRLAISLHAANDDERTNIMGVNRKYAIGPLLDSIRKYQRKTGRRVMFEYCMIKGVNDSDDDAKALARLLKGIKAGINLIEYNPHPGCDFRASSRNRIQAFWPLLIDAGFETIIRYKRGQTIKAACGQLGADWLENGT